VEELKRKELRAQSEETRIKKTAKEGRKERLKGDSQGWKNWKCGKEVAGWQSEFIT